MTLARSISWARNAALLGTLSLVAGGLALEARAAEEAASDGSLYVSQVTTATTGDLAPGAEIVRGDQPIGIGEAVALSIQNNLDVEVERFEPMIAETDASGAWGAYDPTLDADLTYDVAKTPTTSPLQGDVANQRERTKGGGIGVTQLIPWLGASLEARYEGSNQSTRNSFAAYDDQYSSSFFVTANVPLARNLIWNEAWTNVKLSAIRGDSALDDFSARLMDIVQGTLKSYWDLVAARDQVRVSQKSLETARALLEQTKTEYEVGVKSRVAVVEAEAGVAQREFEVIRTANVFRNAQDQLIDAVLGRELSAMTDLQFSPTEDPGTYTTQQVDVAQAVRTAFQSRPELAKLERDIEQDEIDLKFAKNQRLPQLDAQVRLGYRGVSGERNVRARDFGTGGPAPDPPNLGFFDDSDNDFFQSDGSDNVAVTGTFSIPFPNTTARKRVVTSQLELRRSKTRRARLEQDIILDVRSAARGLAAARQGIDAAERARLAAEEQLRAERIRLEHGESTPFEVLQRESDLVEAESAKIDALQAYQNAEVDLERAQGTILDRYNVVLDQAREPTQ